MEKAVEEDSITKKIRHQNFEDFMERVIEIILNSDNKVITNLIGSMDKRIKMLIKCKGGRTKYKESSFVFTITVFFFTYYSLFVYIIIVLL